METVDAAAFLDRFRRMPATAAPTWVLAPDGRRLAFLAMRQWDRLRGNERKALRVEELPEEIARLIEACEPDEVAGSGPGWECLSVAEFAARFGAMADMSEIREVLVEHDGRIAFVLMTEAAYLRLPKVAEAAPKPSR